MRDRFLRLAGMRDLNRTTRAMADATERVGRYLLMQMMMNALFGFGMGLGLTLIGVPNAPLWGVLAFVLRFIPFLGAWIALSLPFVVAVATGQGWMEPVLVLALFALVDGVITHVLEPLFYGRTTGISPLALLCLVSGVDGALGADRAAAGAADHRLPRHPRPPCAGLRLP